MKTFKTCVFIFKTYIYWEEMLWGLVYVKFDLHKRLLTGRFYKVYFISRCNLNTAGRNHLFRGCQLIGIGWGGGCFFPHYSRLKPFTCSLCKMFYKNFQSFSLNCRICFTKLNLRTFKNSKLFEWGGGHTLPFEP